MVFELINPQAFAARIVADFMVIRYGEKNRMRTHLSLPAMLLLCAACNRSGPSSTPSAPAPAASAKVASPVKGSLTRAIEQPGAVFADEETPLYAKLAGYVKQYYVDIGRQVNGPKYEPARTGMSKDDEACKEIKPGDVLAEISIPELEDEANQKAALKKQADTELALAHQLLLIAKENMIAMEASAGEARAGVRRAEANQMRWESEKLRIAKLVRDRTIEQQVFDETLNQFLAAQAALDEARARVTTAESLARKSIAEKDKAEADIKVAEAKLQVAQAEADRLEDLRKYTKIRAPFDGVVTQRKIDTGHFVQPAGSQRAVPLFTVMKIDKVRVVVDVPEADTSIVRVGDTVEIVFASLKNKLITGKVSRTSGALDPASRTLRVEIDLPNYEIDEPIPGKASEVPFRGKALKPGMYVNTRILAKRPESWLLPAMAVIKAGDAMVCFEIAGGKAVRTPVQIGRSDGKLIEVLKKLKPGTSDSWEDWTGKEIVAASNAAYLTDGQAVQVSPP